MRLIPLTQGKHAIVDASDYDRVSKFKWYANRPSKFTWYAMRRVGSAIILMHREIMSPSPDLDVDHLDRDGLNNRRKNLRVCTPAQNSANRVKQRTPASSRYKGVSLVKRTGRWRAYICPGGRQKTLGCFDNEVEAARAHDAAAKEIFGSFAFLNFI